MAAALLPRIPLVDLNAQYLDHRYEFDAAVQVVVDEDAFIGGPEHRAFASEFAAWCGDGSVALVGNGTDGLELTLIELLGQGDGTGEVLTVAHTFIATAEAIVRAGYRPVFVDIDPETCLMDLVLAEAAITERTRAVMPVHLYGQMLDMAHLRTICDRHDLVVVEDAAQAHGADFDGARPGHFGDAAVFSFYPGKNLGAWGDGGAVYSRDPSVTSGIAMRADHGRKSKYVHDFAGVSSRLDGLQAAILRVKLRHIDAWNSARRKIAGWYDSMLMGRNDVARPAVHADANPVWHLYVVRVPDRDRVKDAMNARGVGVGVHYPVPLHLQPAFESLGATSFPLPETERAAREVLSLPIYPELSYDQAARVVDVLTSAVEDL